MTNARFNLSAGGIFCITGLAKLVSAFGAAAILHHIDPIFRIKFAYLMFFSGIIELMVAGACFFSKRQAISSILVAWLATSLLIYRLGLWWIGWHRPCSCLGSFTGALHLQEQTADTTIKVI